MKRKTIGASKPRRQPFRRGTVVRMVNPISLRGMTATVHRREGLLLRVQLVGNRMVSPRIFVGTPLRHNKSLTL